jgi:competence protein ComEC
MNLWRLRRKIHSSWLIAASASGVVGGVIIIQYLPQGWFTSWLWLLAALTLIALSLWSRWVPAIACMVIAGGLLGLWRGGIATQELAPYEKLVGARVMLAGSVTDDVDRDKHGVLVIRLGNIGVDGHSLPGVVRVTVDKDADIKRGDRLIVEGKLADGFGSFAASIHRGTLQKVMRPEPGDVARQVRDEFGDKVRQVINEPAASLGLGYLLGQRRGLPEELDTALRTAGLTHIVVASGYNLTILVRIARRLFVKVSKYLATLSATTMIFGFIAITGMSPSMSRAGLVTGLALLAWYYGRQFHPLVLLPFAAAITLLVNPTYGWGDLGWQLSFAAFAGVMVMAPLLQRYFYGEQKPGLIRQILGETIAAFIVTLPILLYAFGQVSLVAILANVLVLPLVPLAMLLVFLSGVGTLASVPLGMILGSVSTWLLQYMIWVAEVFAGIPWVLLEVRLWPVVAVGMYVVIALGCVYMWRVTRYSLRDVNVVE